MTTLLIHNAHTLATLNDAGDELRNASVFVRDNCIEAVGPGQGQLPTRTGRRTGGACLLQHGLRGHDGEFLSRLGSRHARGGRAVARRAGHRLAVARGVDQREQRLHAPAAHGPAHGQAADDVEQADDAQRPGAHRRGQAARGHHTGQVRGVDGAVLLQDHDVPSADTSQWQVVSTKQPTAAQLRDAAVAWVTCAAVSSNAIVLARDNSAVGIGAGQQNRVDAARIACTRAGERAQGAVAASDAFFPFRDGPDALAAVGVAAIVQPGGSQRDDESIAAANEHGMVMIFSGQRHFRH